MSRLSPTSPTLDQRSPAPPHHPSPSTRTLLLPTSETFRQSFLPPRPSSCAGAGRWRRMFCPRLRAAPVAEEDKWWRVETNYGVHVRLRAWDRTKRNEAFSSCNAPHSPETTVWDIMSLLCGETTIVSQPSTANTNLNAFIRHFSPPSSLRTS